MVQNIDPVIETERLVLDALAQNDAKALFEYRGDPTVARYQGWQPSSFKEAADFISEQSNIKFGQASEWCQLAIRSKQTGELIGDFGVRFPATTADSIEFGLSLSPAHQRKGYAREAVVASINLAFRQWGYRRLVCSVDPRNRASVALFRALDFRQEAYHVESYQLRGEWVDDVIFAMLAREWPREFGVDQ